MATQSHDLMYVCERKGLVHEKNGKPTCHGHRKSDGQCCGNFPINGSTVCRKHGGAAGQVKRKAAEVVQAEVLRAEALRIGIPIDVEHGEAMVALVREAAGNVEFYRQLVQELQIHPDEDEFSVDDEGKPVYKRGASGIYGRTYHVSGIPTGDAKPNILLVLYNEERDRLSSYCQAALKAGIDERRIRLAESTARELFEGVGKAMKKANLTPEQAEVFRVELAAHLRAAESPSLAS